MKILINSDKENIEDIWEVLEEHCPSEFGLPDYCTDCCRDCWEKAFKKRVIITHE